MALEIYFSIMGVARIFRWGGDVFKIFKKILKKIAKNALFFPKSLTNHALIFRAFGRKTQFVGNI